MTRPGLEARVGIVSWNTADLLDACLSAVPAALAGLAAEIVVVDNASDDHSVEVARRHGVRLIENPENTGYARAMNQALGGDPVPFLIALNPDTVPAPDSLAVLVETLRDGPADVGLVAPRLLMPDGSLQHSVYRFPSALIYAAAWFLPGFLRRSRVGRRLWLEGAAPHTESGDIDWAIGAVHAIRADALDGRPPYDERWFMYVEDLELCWWLSKRGWRRRLEVSAEVMHVGNAAGSIAWGASRTRRHVEAAYDWSRRDAGRGRTTRWALVNVVGTLWWAAIHLVRGLARRRRSTVREAIDCLALLPVHLGALRQRNRKG